MKCLHDFFAEGASSSVCSPCDSSFLHSTFTATSCGEFVTVTLLTTKQYLYFPSLSLPSLYFSSSVPSIIPTNVCAPFIYTIFYYNICISYLLLLFWLSALPLLIAPSFLLPVMLKIMSKAWCLSVSAWPLLSFISSSHSSSSHSDWLIILNLQ